MTPEKAEREAGNDELAGSNFGSAHQPAAAWFVVPA
jgi:hypothetical protein